MSDLRQASLQRMHGLHSRMAIRRDVSQMCPAMGSLAGENALLQLTGLEASAKRAVPVRSQRMHKVLTRSRGLVFGLSRRFGYFLMEFMDCLLQSSPSKRSDTLHMALKTVQDSMLRRPQDSA